MDITVRFRYGGIFEAAGGKLFYKCGKAYSKNKVDTDRLSTIEMEGYLKDDIGLISVKELWWLVHGQCISVGLRPLKVDTDIIAMVDDIKDDKVAHVFVVLQGEPSPSSLMDEHIMLPNPSNPVYNQSQPSSNTINHVSSSSHTRLSKSHQLEPCIQLGSDDNEADILGSESSSSDEDLKFQGSDEDQEDDDFFDTSLDPKLAVDVTQFLAHRKEVVNVEEPALLNDSEDGLRSLSDSDGLHKERYPEFNHLTDFDKPIALKAGMLFASNDMFRKALRQYHVEIGTDFYYLHNDKKKVYAYCKHKCECNTIKHGRVVCECGKKRCPFKALARKRSEDGTFQLKSFNGKHECGRQYKNSKITSKWLAERYIELYKDDPHLKLHPFVNIVMREWKVKISYAQAWRTRLRAYLMTQGDARLQYARICDYALTLRKWNPGTNSYVHCSDHPEKPVFQRFYVCLSACKKGFLMGCRPILGLDGCHLKGAYTGQVLSAVGMDGNGNIYPVAYAVVEAERKETWGWFISNLVVDIGGTNICFMSDRQKGLLEALDDIVPLAEKRHCVRHLYNNVRGKCSGKAFKDAVWSAARATNKADYDETMDHIRTKLSKEAHDSLIDADPSTWSRHAFKHSSKSDMLLNNVCESFNSYIMYARDKPILTMCEWIRRALMNRFAKKRKGMDEKNTCLTPMVQKRIEHVKKIGVSECKVNWSGDGRYEVEHNKRNFVVDLRLKSCGCMKWDLTGIPCAHAASCIIFENKNFSDFVDPYYTKETYMKAYGFGIEPMPDEKEWEKDSRPPPEPPLLIIQPGRPKKHRRREEGEGRPSRPKKTFRYQPGKNKCSNCGVRGHSRLKCTKPQKDPSPLKPKGKGGRPRSPSTINVNAQGKKRRRKSQPSGCPPPAPIAAPQSSIVGLGFDDHGMPHTIPEFELPITTNERGNVASWDRGEAPPGTSSKAKKTYPVAPAKKKIFMSQTELAEEIRNSINIAGQPHKSNTNRQPWRP